MNSPTGTATRERLLGSGPAARYAGVHRDTIRRWAERGLITAVRTPGGQYRYRLSDLDSIMQPAAKARA